MSSESFERMRAALESHGASFTGVNGRHFMATCPAHEDRNPSLGVDDRGRKVVMRCYAGCHNDDVIAALGLTYDDLFDDALDPSSRDSMRGTLVRSYLYERGDGQPWFYVDRYWPKTFRQRLPNVAPVLDLADTAAVRRLGLREADGSTRAPLLYHLPRVARAIQRGGAVVWLLDGEKDVETAERHGLVATCPPGFAKEWRPEYGSFLSQAAEVVLVVDQDKEKPGGVLGSGQAFAVAARNGLRALGVPVRSVAPAFGKDLDDHFAAGYKVEDFVRDRSIYTRPRGMSADDLMSRDLPPLEWAVYGVLPAGLTIMAGSPKAGKSWAALDLCLGVSAGGVALSGWRCRQGSAIYLAREDSYRRLQSRIAVLTGGEVPPSSLELVPAEQDWPGGEAGLAALTEWAEEVGDPRLVVIDTIAKLEPDMGESRTRGAYAGNYSMMSAYKQWADRHNCAVLMIHHDRKASGKDESTDPFDKISGTRAMSGACDTLWFLDKKRGEQTGTLHVTGRDVADDAYELLKVGPVWRAVDVPQMT